MNKDDLYENNIFISDQTRLDRTRTMGKLITKLLVVAILQSLLVFFALRHFYLL